MNNREGQKPPVQILPHAQAIDPNCLSLQVDVAATPNPFWEDNHTLDDGLFAGRMQHADMDGPTDLSKISKYSQDSTPAEKM